MKIKGLEFYQGGPCETINRDSESPELEVKERPFKTKRPSISEGGESSPTHKLIAGIWRMR
jgi:hypothetical protein